MLIRVHFIQQSHLLASDWVGILKQIISFFDISWLRIIQSYEAQLGSNSYYMTKINETIHFTAD